MYTKLPNLVIAFHGCEKDVFNSVIFKGEEMKRSENKYDWLGNGIYFWEQNYQRALEWAKNRYKKEAAVIGAVIDLGYCLNLTDSASIETLKQGYDLLKVRCEIAEKEMPVNVPSGKTDVLLRNLDCAVIEQIHDYNKSQNYNQYDSVRGIFIEGGEAFPGSEIKSKTHVQICVRNTNCIKGLFRPREYNSKYNMP